MTKNICIDMIKNDLLNIFLPIKLSISNAYNIILSSNLIVFSGTPIIYKIDDLITNNNSNTKLDKIE